MPFTPKKLSLVAMGIASLVCSRAIFLFIDDPEGPNLLIVTVLAIVIYVAAWVAIRIISFLGSKRSIK